MDAALIDLPPLAMKPRLDTDRVRDVLLLRLAVAGKAVPRDALHKELGQVTAHALAEVAWAAQLDRDLAALADAGLADVKASSAEATEAGVKRAAIVLGGRGPFPRSWTEARDIRLMAKALGIEGDAPSKLKALAKPDGLRAAIIVKGFGLKLRGTPSVVKLRTVLAKVALSRAFGNSVDAVSGRTGLSAKAGRALAGRLARDPQDFRTDARLIAALAADQVQAERHDLAGLQLALLRRFVLKGDAPALAVSLKKKRKATVSARLKLVAPPSPERPASTPAQSTAQSPAMQQSILPAASARPTLPVFVADVMVLATPVAEGFFGNRRAFISRVWATIAKQRPHWGLSEVEFKCMLGEAHRLGQLVLANADLKDGRHLAEIQASALSYKNAVFHYVRIDT